MGKWVHRLSEIDEDARTAVCANCGPTRIRKNTGTSKWRCASKVDYTRGKYKGQAHRQFLGLKCERCGFDPVDECQLDVHHKDRDHTNNAPSNLETICANCHRLEHKS
jgi:hypothetical protein